MLHSLFLGVLLCTATIQTVFSLSFVPRSGLKGLGGESWEEAIQQATQLIGNLSIEEKVSLATGVGWANGVCVGNTPAIPSISFPGLCLQDSPTGVRFADFASAFPAAINVAATWDRNLTFQRAAAMGAEYRGKGVNVALAPMMNMGRVAAGGRNWEGFGADPYLTGEGAIQTVLGIQSQGVIATAKHYIGNEQEHYRTTETSDIDDRTIHEIYAYPFLQSVLAGVGSVMCSYNQVNGTYACQNNRTLNQILKGEFGFLGFVMSDWAATMSGVPSVLGGLDMTMPGDITFGSGTSYFGANLVKAVQNGSVSEARLDDMAVRILTPWFLLGQNQNFPAPNINSFYPAKSQHVPVGGDHYQVIREIGAASTILLKNINNQLPFTTDTSGGGIVTYGLIGSDAGPAELGPNGCPDHGCVAGTLAQGWGSGTTNFPYLITPLEAIQARAADNGQTVAFSLDDWDVQQAMEVARYADVAIVFTVADSGEGYIDVDGNAGDRNNLTAWNNGDILIEAVASVNSHTIVVLHTVGPVLMPWASNPNVTAIVIAGLPGQESGNSLSDVLFGDVNPSAKLVYTIANQASDYPAQVLYSSPAPHPIINYTEGLYIDYRWFDAKNIEPAFEFGFGLSYTTFSYSNLQIQATTEQANAFSDADPVLYKIQALITNTGKVAGYEVPQLYIVYPASAEEPPKVLKGFDRVWVDPQQATQVVFYLTELQLSIWNVSIQDWTVPVGQYGVLVGASSRNILLKGSFTH
jgi:beta-glucosidase